MSYENINIKNSNFCMGPQSGTVCTIDLSSPKTVMKVINMTGSTIFTFNLSSNIVVDNVKLEYVGPTNMTSLKNGLFFFTLEKVDDDTCMIKRWESDVNNNELSLKEQVVKKTSGDLPINAVDFAVEHYFKSFTRPNEKYDYLYVDDAKNIQKGTKLIVGPSTDSSNIGVTEVATVTNVSYDINGYKISLNNALSYEYAIGDSIVFYSNVYLYSSLGYGGDANKGSLIKMDAYSWQVKEIDSKAFYKRVTSSRWCPQMESVASVVDTNLFFVRPYDSYLNWRSMFLNNVNSDEYSFFSVYDIIFDNYNVYKLQKYISLRSAAGSRSVYSWDNYNFQQDTLVNYANNLSTRIDNYSIYGYNKTTLIRGFVRDQYFSGLKNITINFSRVGDTAAAFSPLNGVVLSDIDGAFSIAYITGSTYEGATVITANASGSSIYTGSNYVNANSSIFTTIQITDKTCRVYALNTPTAATSSSQKDLQYKVLVQGDTAKSLPSLRLECKSFFTNLGGDWGSASSYPNAAWVGPDKVKTWLPMLYLGKDLQIDSPRGGSADYGFEIVQNQSLGVIRQNLSVSAYTVSSSKLWFLNYIDNAGIGAPIHTSINTKSISTSCAFSQLKISPHTYMVNGTNYDKLYTYISVEQFVFIEEAVPEFWSAKNPVDTSIWLRLRPYAFSLNPDRTELYVRELSFFGDTGYKNVTSETVITTFNAGSSILGIELSYTPATYFMNNSRIFVIIKTYDIASSPNMIYLEYWFDIVPDYKTPYLTNISPYREEYDVDTSTKISFTINDEGAGIDITTLECFINSRIMHSEDMGITKISDNRYDIIYTPPTQLFNDKEYKVTVKVQDLSDFENRMNDSFRFYTESSSGVSIIDMHPSPCERGLNRFENVEFKLLSNDSGVDVSTLKVQVFNKDVHPNVIPIIYRVE